MNLKNRTCIGIDLGTTNSVLSTVNKKPNGEIVAAIVDIPRAKEMYHNVIQGKIAFTPMRENTLPSVIYYCEEDNYKPMVGNFAKDQYSKRNYLVAKSIKSQMGNKVVSGLVDEIPDKTPAEVSSRILQHILTQFKKIHRLSDIKDAVITVPANFDPIMCKATLEAAELAGLETKYPDGTEKPMLLSEPNAVIYNLYNDIKNGQISADLLNKKQNIMVFDLGGGTLDITFHKIEPSNDINEPLNIQEIATNRYTLLGGDDFDKALAENMYKRYLEHYNNYNKDIVKAILKNEKDIMPELIKYAEILKVQANGKFSSEFDNYDFFDILDEDSDNNIDISINLHNGYSYNDVFSKKEIEEILSIYMGEGIVFNDYNNLETIIDNKNIIYPILDVLAKASKSNLLDGDVKVDAVILNGGMSKFYMVKERIEEFFGFEPLTIMDPDLSVAKGAAVYHHLLLNNPEIEEHYKVSKEECNENNPEEFLKKIREKTFKKIEKEKNQINEYGLKIGGRTLNEALYLGLKNNDAIEIISHGERLPYYSEKMTDFKISSGQNKIAIPIQTKEIDGSYRTIANGNIFINNDYPNGAFVTIILSMTENKLIHLDAWISKDKAGKDVLEKAGCNIDITTENIKKIQYKNINKSQYKSVQKNIVENPGKFVDAEDAIERMLQIYRDIDARNINVRVGKKEIDLIVDDICSAGNKKDFARPILKGLHKEQTNFAETRLFVIARKIGESWTKYEKLALADICIKKLSLELRGLSGETTDRSKNIEIIRTLSICDNGDYIKKLTNLNNKSYYKQALIYTYGRTSECLNSLKAWFLEDIRRRNSMQDTGYFMGLAYRRDKEIPIFDVQENKILEQYLDVISSGNLDKNSLISCIIGVGFMCDQRYNNNTIEFSLLKQAENILRKINYIYNKSDLQGTTRAINLVLKMINGQTLVDAEEKYLLERIN